jgi:hypothetical protein
MGRSSLLSHSFPSFYACYLLKSIQTPTSTASVSVCLVQLLAQFEAVATTLAVHLIHLNAFGWLTNAHTRFPLISPRSASIMANSRRVIHCISTSLLCSPRAGAHKTRLRRPWVMQMIVYGFPSKLVSTLRATSPQDLIFLQGRLAI